MAVLLQNHRLQNYASLTLKNKNINLNSSLNININLHKLFDIQLIQFTCFRYQLLQISIQFTIGQILTRLGGAEELLVDLHLTDYALNRPISMFFIP